MLPRRSNQLRQTASHSTVSLSADHTTKSIAKTAEKGACTGSSSDVDAVNQPRQTKPQLVKPNLGSFPTEILERIFLRSDDVELLNLANTCTRFEAVAQTVFSQRYADKFFLINDDRHGLDPEIYAAIFDCFGGYIKAIQLNHIEEDESTIHWASKLIQSRINQIEKLTYNDCTFQSIDMLSKPLKNATHLVFRDVRVFGKVFDLPKCRNLVELEISKTSSYKNKSLHRMIRCNPALQRVILKNFSGSYDRDSDNLSIINLIANHLTCIKELVLYEECYKDWDSPLTVSQIRKIAKSFKHLESLSINAGDNNMVELLPHLVRGCKNLKHLGLFEYDDEIDGEMFRSFEQIESLHVKSNIPVFKTINLPVENFPNLRHLILEMFDFDEDEFSDLLPLLHQCQTLQRITIVSDEWAPQYFINAESFEKFIEATIVAGKPNFQIDVAGNVGSVTANGVIWRNKLMFWMDYSKNDTNIHLLDLADHSIKADATKKAVDRTNLMDKIFDYLDLESLDVLADINERTQRLVNNYVTKHAKAHKSLFITNECRQFKHDLSIFDRLESLRLITDLSIFCLYDYCSYSITKFIGNFELLNNLSIYDQSSDIIWPILKMNFSRVVYDSPHFLRSSKLIEMVECFPRVETIECKNAGLFRDSKSVKIKANMFSQLKKFTFNYRGETQMKNLKKIFKNTTVQLVPIR